VLAGDRRSRALHDRARGAEYRSLADAHHKRRPLIARTLPVIALEGGVSTGAVERPATDDDRA
jgi:hypothetical protein